MPLRELEGLDLGRHQAADVEFDYLSRQVPI
jgi:hypothetical protein